MYLFSYQNHTRMFVKKSHLALGVQFTRVDWYSYRLIPHLFETILDADNQEFEIFNLVAALPHYAHS